jgi:diadenosine tetraphosphatase ApaH/serine/threonine PP2A family protein phosphatase
VAIALVSDLHSNIEAVEAVMADIEREGVETIYCLGDVIDYGPNPTEVLDIAVERFKLNILGNHEEALMNIAEDFNERAMRSVHWTRDAMNNPELSREKRKSYWNFLDEMAKTKSAAQKDLLFLHGSPRQPTRDYIFPKDIRNTEKMDQIFAKLAGEQRYCFCGHSHIPGIYTDKYQYAHPSRIKDGKVNLSRFERLLVNIGSVGQPRDNDIRASYVILDGEEVTFRRVPYDHQKTVDKIRAIEQLPSFLAERLLVGK